MNYFKYTEYNFLHCVNDKQNILTAGIFFSFFIFLALPLVRAECDASDFLNKKTKYKQFHLIIITNTVQVWNAVMSNVLPVVVMNVRPGVALRFWLDGYFCLHQRCYVCVKRTISWHVCILPIFRKTIFLIIF